MDKLKTLYDNIISESIDELETKYGTNKECDDNQIKVSTIGDQTIYVTYFYHDSYKCKVLLYSDGTIAYGIASKEDERKWILHPSKKETTKLNLFKLYGKVIFLLKILIKKYKVTYIQFTASEKKLDRIYSAMLEKDSFKTMMKELGFTLSTKNNKEGEKVYIAKQGLKTRLLNKLKGN